MQTKRPSQLARDAYKKHNGKNHDARETPQDPPLMAELSRITFENTYGTSWSRGELDLRTKSFLSMAITATLGTEEQFKSHVRAAQHVGVTRKELVAMLIHFMGYLGAPRTSVARKLMREVWQEPEKKPATSGRSGRKPKATAA